MQVQIAHVGRGYQCYRTEFGRDRDYVGPIWPTPREASRFADLIDQPYIDPLRESGMGSRVGDPRVLLPPTSVEPMPDAPRERRRRTKDRR